MPSREAIKYSAREIFLPFFPDQSMPAEGIADPLSKPAEKHRDHIMDHLGIHAIPGALELILGAALINPATWPLAVLIGLHAGTHAYRTGRDIVRTVYYNNEYDRASAARALKQPYTPPRRR